MAKRLGILVFLAATLAAVLIWQRTRGAAAPDAQVTAATPAADPQHDEDPIHLRPDRRGLIAVSEVDRLLTGHAGKPALARFEAGRWTVFQGPQVLGTLPE